MPTSNWNDRYAMPYEEGDDNYDDGLNNNLDSLATDVPNSGTLSNRSNAGQQSAPDVYYANEDGAIVVYFNTGSSWQTVNIPTQSARDGHVVPVAPGLSIRDAIDIDAATTPVQDAIDAIEAVGVSADNRYGAGTVLLPPGITDTPGNLHTLGGKQIIGHGREASVLRVTDPSNHCFALGGPGANKTKAYLDGFTIHGGSRSDRVGGSAITTTFTPSDAATADMVSVGFNIGQLQFQNWGGPDPVIQNFPAYSSKWGFLRALDYDGQFMVSESGHSNDIGMIHIHHDDPQNPAIEFQEPFGSIQIGDINAGGAIGRTVQHNGPFSRMMSFRIGKVNVEPDAAGDSYSLPSGQAPVELNGSTPVHIQSVSIQEQRLSTEHVVLMGDNQEEYPGNTNVGIGNNSIGPSPYANGTISVIGLRGGDVLKTSSWFWGVDGQITRNGHPSNSCIPMKDLDFTP